MQTGWASDLIVALWALPWQVRNKTIVGLDADLNVSARFIDRMDPDGGPSSLVPSDSDRQRIRQKYGNQSRPELLHPPARARSQW